jgi:hypothetical protein
VAERARKRLDRQGTLEQRSFASVSFASWSTPWYGVAYLGTIGVLVLSLNHPWPFALALWFVAGVCGVSCLRFHHPVWLYPACVSLLAAWVTSIKAIDPTIPFETVAALLGIPTSFLLIASFARQRSREVEAERRRDWLGSGRALDDRWAAPPFLAGVLAMAASVAASATDSMAGLILALGYAVLVSAFAVLWQGEAEAWVALALAGMAGEQVLRVQQVIWIDHPFVWASAALAGALASFAMDHASAEVFKVWRRPLYFGSLGVGAFALVVALGNAGLIATRSSMSALVVVCAMSGLTLVAHGFNRWERRLGYAGVALVEGACMLQLMLFDVGQPQAFVLPAGLYLLAIAYLEWRRGTGAHIKPALEAAALALLLGASLLQALGSVGAGIDRHLYVMLLLLEGLALLGAGAALRWKRPFFAGEGAIVIAVIIASSDPLRDIGTVYAVGVIGLLMVVAVVFLEQRRQQIPLWLNAWRLRLEQWE